MRLPSCSVLLASLLVASLGLGKGGSSVMSTQHNLSVSGPGKIKSATETRVCIFCHTSHSPKAVAPLWNRELPKESFIPYQSTSLDATRGGQLRSLEGSSRLCLSCHDGTLALGATLRGRRRGQRQIDVGGTVAGRLPPTSKGFLGRNLSGSHPIGITVDDKLISLNNSKDSPLASLREMHADRDVKLDRKNRIQCTTCHDAHDDSNFASAGIHFYNKPRYSDTCRVCHKIF